MSALGDIRNEVAQAISNRGWETYRVMPDTTPRFPCALVSVSRVEYQKSYGGRLTAFVDVEVIASASDYIKAQDIIDEACSWATDWSIPSAVQSYDGYETVGAVTLLSTEGFDSLTINDDIPAYSATIHLEILTRT